MIQLHIHCPRTVFNKVDKVQQTYIYMYRGNRLLVLIYPQHKTGNSHGNDLSVLLACNVHAQRHIYTVQIEIAF